MEEIYVSAEYGPRSSERRFMEASVFCLGLLNVFLVAGLIGLCVYYHGSVNELDAELSTVKANLTQSLQASSNSEERDQLNALLFEMTKELNSLSGQNHGSILGLDEELSTVKSNLTQCLQANNNFAEERNELNAKLFEMNKELNKLQRLFRQNKTCPIGWTMFSHSCYLLSNESGSWEKGREDCRAREADLLVIDSRDEQTFLSEFNRGDTWIGLNDIEIEGTWKWIDGTPLTLMYWEDSQPDNGGGDPLWGEEDCAHIRPDTVWNDMPCRTALKWICEKIA